MVAGVLEFLQGLDDLAEDLAVQLDAELVRLQLDGGPTRHLRHEEAGAVANQLRVYVFVCVAPARYGAGVQAGLVGERRGPDIRLLGIGGEVDQLGHVVGHRRQLGEPPFGQRLHPHLEAEVGDDRHQVAVADPLPVAVDGSLHLGGSTGHAGQGVCHPTAGVVVQVHAHLAVHCCDHRRDHLLHLAWKRSTVGVAQHQAVGPGLGGAEQHP